MLRTRASLAARRNRISKLKQQRLGYPRRKIAVQSLLLAVVVLLLPIFLPSGVVAELADEELDGMMLAIDSPIFTLDYLAVTEDGFLIKNTGQSCEIDNSDLADLIEYTVEEGDVLSSIARRFGVSMDTIIWENKITNPHQLRPGTQLAILPVSGITHEVKEDDSITKIAKKYGIDSEKLYKQNQLESETKLIAGTKLIIPGGKKTVSAGNGNYLASRSPGTYASYKPPVAIDGAIIITNGAKDKDGKWMVKPTIGKYTTYFGGRKGHWAVDIADRSKPPIVAAADGTVVKSQCGWNGGYGCVIVLDHGDGFQTLYAHLSELAVGVGDSVQQNSSIGTMGNTGRVWGTTGIHLHFEVVDNGVKKNPLAYYSE
ncbi:peptidoglycan DD-metalloendopeptidase family protein [Candidatus Gracilibacteria bacterium]|nr:peptidoglycan DD-metalloendopeptidase family protein [Candidatus Gracilibacteria bacterium]